jgi:hypothetical protein
MMEASPHLLPAAEFPTRNHNKTATAILLAHEMPTQNTRDFISKLKDIAAPSHSLLCFFYHCGQIEPHHSGFVIDRIQNDPTLMTNPLVFEFQWRETE